MKKIYKTFTFYFVIIGIIIVMLNILGQDDMNILMIGLNPLLNLLDNNKAICDVMNSSRYLWHIASIVTNILYGLILDFIKVKRKKNLWRMLWIKKIIK